VSPAFLGMIAGLYGAPERSFPRISNPSMQRHLNLAMPFSTALANENPFLLSIDIYLLSGMNIHCSLLVASERFPTAFGDGSIPYR
jgi:hypothetical protein